MRLTFFIKLFFAVSVLFFTYFITPVQCMKQVVNGAGKVSCKSRWHERKNKIVGQEGDDWRKNLWQGLCDEWEKTKKEDFFFVKLFEAVHKFATMASVWGQRDYIATRNFWGECEYVDVGKGLGATSKYFGTMYKEHEAENRRQKKPQSIISIDLLEKEVLLAGLTREGRSRDEDCTREMLEDADEIIVSMTKTILWKRNAVRLLEPRKKFDLVVEAAEFAYKQACKNRKCLERDRQPVLEKPSLEDYVAHELSVHKDWLVDEEFARFLSTKKNLTV